MTVRRPATVLALATALLVTSVQVPGASAHELAVDEDGCTITYTGHDADRVNRGLDQAILASYDQISRSIPMSSAYDISQLTNYVFDNWGKRDFSTVEAFRGTPVNGVATRLNRHAINAGYRDNEIFEIIAFQYEMSLRVVTEREAVMGQTQPVTMSHQEALITANSIRTTDLTPRGQFSRAGQRSVDFLARQGHGLLERIYEPVFRCADGDSGNGLPDLPGMVFGSSGSS
ncbi:hypothetical protein HMPREF0290_2764 [Corynebacterium efficiens YS-314]|uniref:Secreted protein n=1 Tax=Corynebacterium efficiens (strain DSM 44549 / YS-314 / AJ 12310 / JCM 11189 / NBRC 100395) TaxID=196164 RepID=Q8FSX4_COREF|nr:hypothetical protein [Corynebacterium efficiens]EEW48632.1 hypothetical protein HMPREF0290_2764 [Corynebacterium efficiens YS-314]BAC19730.1 hypothetical protein [Corynebacterium efficiens YS-314]